MKILRALILILVSLVAIFPLYWQLNGSFMENLVVVRTPPPLLPIGGDLENYKVIIANFPIWKWFLNSAVVCLGTVGLQLFIALPAAYAIEIKRFRGHRIVWGMFLASMMLTSQLSLIPLYRLMRVVGLTTRRLGLILPFCFSVLPIFILRSYLKSFPRAVLDAAEIDGAGEGRRLIGIVVPMCIPVLTALGAISMVGAWNNYFWQSIVANTARTRTLVVGVARVIYDYVIYRQLGVEWVDYGVLMAGAMIVFLPMGLFFVFSCRYAFKGLFAGREG